MERAVVLVLALIIFVLFVLLGYYGARLTWWAAIVLGTLVTLILLNMLYPPSMLASTDADWTVVIYAFVQLVGFIILFVYIAQRCLTDVRADNYEIWESPRYYLS